jgi:proteasome lid subunit RPN8/RPN11
MTALRVVLEPVVVQAIRDHAAETYPHECCGALIGRAGEHRVTEALALPNATEEGPRRRFSIRPDDYRRAERHASERSLDLLGFYHSHPDHPARPSETDLARAWPNFHYVIVSVREGRPEDVRSWRLVDDRSMFTEEQIIDP